MQTEHTLSIFKANKIGLISIVPTILIFGIPFYWIWSVDIHQGINEYLTQFKFLIDNVDSQLVMLLWFVIKLPIYYFVLLLLGIVVHELIHGAVFAIFTKKGWESVSFGVFWKSFTPYAHCNEAISINRYRVVLIMPGLLLGIFHAIISLFTGNVVMLIFGIIFTFTASGDFLMLWELRKYRKVKVLDHQAEYGFYIIE